MPTRFGTFETNSSSTHSISCSHHAPRKVTLNPTPGGVIFSGGGEFGWGYECYSDAQGRLDYAVAFIDSYGTDEQWDMLHEVVKEYTGYPLETYARGNNGYVDHQSDTTLNEFIVSKEALTDFIFDDKYEVIIDNDNH